MLAPRRQPQNHRPPPLSARRRSASCSSTWLARSCPKASTSTLKIATSKPSRIRIRRCERASCWTPGADSGNIHCGLRRNTEITTPCFCQHRPITPTMSPRRTIDPSTFDELIGPAVGSAPALSRFTVHGGTSPVAIEVPTAIAYRIHRIGQAYGSRTLSQLAPGVRVVIGSIDIRAFERDLRGLLELVNDETLHGHIKRILAALEAPPGVSAKSVAAFCGAVDERRA